ncbi:HPr(Ser) kinase/phosphatase [Candidatus Epulonipiscium viviparus]|uniref:HPr(Ser) kinase/phosphatase n=1 Tax=Candidatus Epulonipiscium viviparus TaxID=420336 RepID=UPI0027380618|nr:HPr(Ser) kinase/phosphatase [Candidatus Epulopiscium viviparus]
MTSKNKVKVSKLTEFHQLKLLTKDTPYDTRYISDPDVNRPALQLAGFFDCFDQGRVQVIGTVEHMYLQQLDKKERLERLEKFFSYTEIPCVVVSKIVKEVTDILMIAQKYNIPVFQTGLGASQIMAEIIRWLNVELGPNISIHGVLVDIYGEGILITGDSGVGKSETALELVRRGHRLVADDAVEIKRVSGTTLVGTAPEVLRHFIEVRGIGIVNIKELFGIEAVKQTKEISLVIQLETWDKDKQYDRLGLENEYTEILGLQVVTHRIPIRPGRNLAIICETAAVNYRQKLMGYNAAEELNKRVMDNLQKNMRENKI